MNWRAAKVATLFVGFLLLCMGALVVMFLLIAWAYSYGMQGLLLLGFGACIFMAWMAAYLEASQ